MVNTSKIGQIKFVESFIFGEDNKVGDVIFHLWTNQDKCFLDITPSKIFTRDSNTFSANVYAIICFFI